MCKEEVKRRPVWTISTITLLLVFLYAFVHAVLSSFTRSTTNKDLRSFTSWDEDEKGMQCYFPQRELDGKRILNIFHEYFENSFVSQDDHTNMEDTNPTCSACPTHTWIELCESQNKKHKDFQDFTFTIEYESPTSSQYLSLSPSNSATDRNHLPRSTYTLNNVKIISVSIQSSPSQLIDNNNIDEGHSNNPLH